MYGFFLACSPLAYFIYYVFSFILKVTDEDIPRHLVKKLEEEGQEEEKRRKEEREAHLYLKVLVCEERKFGLGVLTRILFVLRCARSEQRTVHRRIPSAPSRSLITGEAMCDK